MTLPLDEARKRDEIISLADSQILRFIDEINDQTDADAQAKQIAKEIRHLKRQPTSRIARSQIRSLYTSLDSLQFKKDYISLIIDRTSDYHRALKGFKINDVEYVRLLGTNGGVKNSTIVFVSKFIAPELKRRIENGRDESVEFVPAKLEAYKSLVCSGSIPISHPNGVLVVSDCKTTFKDNYIEISDANSDEPEMKIVENADVELEDSDGYGLMLPSRARLWAQDLGETYLPSGICVRNAWTKGMLFTFDFHAFADRVAGNYFVKDIWGDEVDIRTVDVILTASMLKLWASYKSWGEYWEDCIKNQYTFSATKICPEKLENERNLNYQFIQTFGLTDDDIEELCAPTIREVRDVLGGDYRKSILFLKGMFLREDSVEHLDCDYAKALMIEPEMINDPYVRSRLKSMLRKRMTESKYGVLKVNGNFAIVSGDPYSLCQSVFDMPVTGLLKSGEIYHRYWLDKKVDTVLGFRAPMTSHNNIRKLKVTTDDEMDEWYQYMTTCIVLNSWDMTCHACNGMDKDSDMLLTTDNPVLLRRMVPSLAIQCVQQNAKKMVPTEADFVRANIGSFGDQIGSITNRITTMIEVQARYPKDSKEYEVLDYRVKCGQLLQQNQIDAGKGIIAKPMPKHWYDRKSATATGDPMLSKIVAHKKPYFMRYRYSDVGRQYSKFIFDTTNKCLREFGGTVEDLLLRTSLSPEEESFISYYRKCLPVGVAPCTMNRICWHMESAFGENDQCLPDAPFNSEILKSGTPYSDEVCAEIKCVYNDYTRYMRDMATESENRRISDREDLHMRYAVAKADFIRRCATICPNEYELCDILVDICYTTNTSKEFAWSVCGETMLKNLLACNGYAIAFPVADEFGDIFFSGNRFSMQYKIMGDD